ncbi:DUF2752 domain-containing protein [Lachnospiraceae bacterium ZAX-1]
MKGNRKTKGNGETEGSGKTKAKQEGTKPMEITKKGKDMADSRKKMSQNSKKNDERVLYGIGWAVMGLLFLFWLWYTIAPIDLPVNKYLFPCLLHFLTGYYCPGCGGTRAVKAFLEADFIASAVYHPFVMYSVIIGGGFMASHTIEKISRNKIKIGLKYRDIYLWIALAIVAVNFIVKNIALFMGVDLLNIR